MIRSESAPDMANGFPSRRSSYYGGNDQTHNAFHRQSQSQPQVGGYYGGRVAASRESYTDGYGPPPLPGPSRNRYSQRLQSEPVVPRYNGNGQPVYPSHSHQQSRDTVNTGDTSGSHSEPWGYSTDPSSENSSIDKVNPISTKPDLAEQYGFNGFGSAPNFGASKFRGPIMEEYDSENGGAYPQSYSVKNGGGNYLQHHISNPQSAPTQSGPAVPPKGVIKLGPGSAPPLSSSSGNTGPYRPSLQHTPSEKRKSWFKRRISRKE